MREYDTERRDFRLLYRFVYVQIILSTKGTRLPVYFFRVGIYIMKKVKKLLMGFIFTELFNALYIIKWLRQNVWSVDDVTDNVFTDCIQQQK